MGGDQIQLLVAKANDSEIYVELTPLGQPASTRRTLKDLAQVVETLHVARAWTRDVADPVWAADRPISWEAAKERLAQLLYATQTMRTAAARAAQAPAPAPAPVPQQASLAPPSAAAYAAAFVGAAHKKTPGESRLEKCTAPQREGRTVCTSQVLGPLQEQPLLDGEQQLGSATARGTPLEAELRRMRTLPGPGAPHAACALVASSGTRLDGDAQGAVPVNLYQLRRDALACLVSGAEEAVGRRRCSRDVRKKIEMFCEALLAGGIELELAVELLGGIAPAEEYVTFGFDEGLGTWGKMSVKAEIKQALLATFALMCQVHVPLLGMDATPQLDFGLAHLFKRALHMTCERLIMSLREAFRLLAHEFEQFRTTLSAPTPCLTRAIADAISTALEPLAREQQTVRAAQLAAREEAKKVAKEEAGSKPRSGESSDISAIKKELALLRSQMRTATAHQDGALRRTHATTRPRDHATRDHATTRPRDHATTRSHDHAIT
jgi:hypothetical protein